MKLLGIVLISLLAGCTPAFQTYTGLVTKVQRRPDLEATCGIGIKAKDNNVCHEPPVCCAYKITMKDSTDHTRDFYAFWPDFAPGLKYMELRKLKVTGHYERIYEFPCTMYGCRTFWDYVIESDDDWRVVD